MLKTFVWIPGHGVDAAALQRLQSQFGKPAEPMGEAWFMGEHRRMFPELRGPLDPLPTSALHEPLVEIASGTLSFGPQREWHAWYHFLLGQLLPRGHEAFAGHSLLEILVTGFMSLYPNGVHREPYAGFREDALQTLGRCMMDAACWHGTDIALGKVLRRSNDNPNRVWMWWDASGDLSASMFFCLKYLPEPLVEGWLRSVFGIRSPHWRAQLIVWLVGAHGLLTDAQRWPSEFSMAARPGVGWDWSHVLRAEMTAADDSGAPSVTSFIPAQSRAIALEVARSYFSEDVFLDWLDSVSTVPDLEAELAEIPSTFEALYVR